MQERSKFGFLEKHKDYVKRAKDYHRKQDTLKVLKSKGKERNEDEFYFGMNSKRVGADGMLMTSRHGAQESDGVLNMDQVKLLKTQDSNYVRTMRLVEARKSEKKKNSMLFASSGKHMVFVEDQEQMEDFVPEEYFKTSTEMVNRRENRLRSSQLEALPQARPQALQVTPTFQRAQNEESLQKKKLKAYKAIARHMERESQLAGVEERMNLQREVMKSGSKKKVEVNGKVTYKWKKQRKR